MDRREFLQHAAGVPVLLSTPAVSASTPQTAGVGGGGSQTPTIVREGQGRYGEVHRLGGRNPVDLKLSSNDTGGALAVWESRSVGKGGPSYHVHHDTDEWFFVIEGDFTFKLGEQLLSVNPGDSIFVKRGIPHTWTHRGTGTGRILFLVQPAGLLEAFFRESATRTRTLTQQEAETFFEAHGMTLLGPPLPIE